MCDEEKLNQADPIIDLGTGNGVMLRELDEFGFTSLTGVDYSQGLECGLFAELGLILMEHIYKS